MNSETSFNSTLVLAASSVSHSSSADTQHVHGRHMHFKLKRLKRTLRSRASLEGRHNLLFWRQDHSTSADFLREFGSLDGAGRLIVGGVNDFAPVRTKPLCKEYGEAWLECIYCVIVLVDTNITTYEASRSLLKVEAKEKYHRLQSVSCTEKTIFFKTTTPGSRKMCQP